MSLAARERTGDGFRNPTPGYIVLYLATVIVVAWGFEFVPSAWLEQVTASVSSDSLRALGFSSSWYTAGRVSFIALEGGSRDVATAIIRECTAIHVFAIFTGLVLPLRAGLARKALGLAIAGPFLFLLNTTRVMLTVLLTGFDVPPFAWIFTHPTVETYHYPLSFIYGLLGVALLVVTLSRWILPELGQTLVSMFGLFSRRGRRVQEQPGGSQEERVSDGSLKPSR